MLFFGSELVPVEVLLGFLWIVTWDKYGMVLVQWYNGQVPIWRSGLMFGHVFRVLIYVLLYENMILLHETNIKFLLYLLVKCRGIGKSWKGPWYFQYSYFCYFIKVKHVLIIGNPWALIYSHGFYDLMILIWSQSSHSMIFYQKVLMLLTILQNVS